MNKEASTKQCVASFFPVDNLDSIPCSFGPYPLLVRVLSPNFGLYPPLHSDSIPLKFSGALFAL
jgi:hypothetical protein